MNNSSNIFLPKQVSSGARKQAPSGSGKPNQNVPLYKFYLKTFADAVGRRLKGFKPMSYSSGTPAVSSQQKPQQVSQSQSQTSPRTARRTPPQTGVGHTFKKDQFHDYVGGRWATERDDVITKHTLGPDGEIETCTLEMPGRTNEVWRFNSENKTWRRTQ